MRGDEARVVEAFSAYLSSEGWQVEREVDFVDVRATRDRATLYAEAKGRSQTRSAWMSIPSTVSCCAGFPTMPRTNSLASSFRQSRRLRPSSGFPSGSAVGSSLPSP